MLLGAIDVGTNSIHLIVVELDPRFGTSRTILKAREMVRLGGGDALTRGYLPRKAMQRGVEAIARFAAEARRAGAEEVRAVATSAVREAENGGDFVRVVRDETGIELTVIRGEQEARLIYLGARAALNLAGKKALIIDIGGGSVELIVGDAREAHYATSLKLGVLRLLDQKILPEREVWIDLILVEGRNALACCKCVWPCGNAQCERTGSENAFFGQSARQFCRQFQGRLRLTVFWRASSECPNPVRQPGCRNASG